MIRKFTAVVLTCLPLIFFAVAAGYAENNIGADKSEMSGTVSQGKTGRVSMDFENTALKNVLKAFSRQTGISFIANDIIESKKVTVFLNDVSIENALASILEANGLLYERQEGNVYLIKPAGKDVIKTITKVYKLCYLSVYKMAGKDEAMGATTSSMTVIGSPAIAEAGSIATSTANAPAPSPASSGESGKTIIDVVRSLMSKYGRIVPDRRNNSLIITDIPDVFPGIEKTIKELDVEPLQIMIQAEIVETTTSALKRIGLEYGNATYLAKITYTGSSSSSEGKASTTNPTFPTAFPFTENFIKDVYNTSLAASKMFSYGTIRVSDTDIVLKMLAQDEDTKYLSRPKIMTLNNEMAIIKIGANTAVGKTSSSVTQTGETISTAERSVTGITLKVTPQVNEKGDIFMNIEPSVSRAKASAFFSTEFMDPSYRSAMSTVMVRDGETIVVGGLIEADDTKATRKIPILGDIPIVGVLFTSRSKTREDTELLIFISPHIVKKRDTEYITPKELAEREYMMQETLNRHSSEYLRKKESEEEAKTKRSAGSAESAMDAALQNYSSGGRQAGTRTRTR